jgi:hypothetical protein
VTAVHHLDISIAKCTDVLANYADQTPLFQKKVFIPVLNSGKNATLQADNGIKLKTPKQQPGYILSPQDPVSLNK